MISERRFTDLTQYQRRLDAEIDAKVRFLFLCFVCVNCSSICGAFCEHNECNYCTSNTHLKT